jgi:peptide/nickel transport system ATP-binding protein
MNTAQSPGPPKVLLAVEALQMIFAPRPSLFRRRNRPVRAVDGVSFTLYEGETLGIVGESGCGKSTLARCILGAYRPNAGRIRFRGRNGAWVDLATLNDKQRLAYCTDLRVVFQDPQASLNPRLSIREIVGEVLRLAGTLSKAAIDARVRDLLTKVGLRPEYARRYPHALSGGERQRVGIARALAPEPRLVILDEAVSALDVSVRAQTLNLLRDLQDEMGLTYLFVSHDLSVVEYICDRVLVMYVGQVVEIAAVADLFHHPRHPYTEALLSALPIPDPDRARHGRRVRLPGDVADPANRPAGCGFHPRCRFATERCGHEAPALRAVGASEVACHHAEQLALMGVEHLTAASPAGPPPRDDTGIPT